MCEALTVELETLKAAPMENVSPTRGAGHPLNHRQSGPCTCGALGLGEALRLPFPGLDTFLLHGQGPRHLRGAGWWFLLQLTPRDSHGPCPELSPKSQSLLGLTGSSQPWSLNCAPGPGLSSTEGGRSPCAPSHCPQSPGDQGALGCTEARLGRPYCAPG